MAYDYCPECNGSGEAFTPGLLCKFCLGMGEVEIDEEEEEENEDSI